MSHSPPFTISVANKSGTIQSYAVFSEVPTIRSSGTAPGISKKSTIRIITSVKGVSSGEGVGYFTLSKKLYAVCGTYDVDGDPGEGRYLLLLGFNWAVRLQPVPYTLTLNIPLGLDFTR